MPTDARQEFIYGLRNIANALEENADMPIPYVSIYQRVEEASELLAIVKGYGGQWQKSTDSADFNMLREFGGIKFMVYVSREKVCKRIVVGKKVVPESIQPATEEKIIPEHEEEIVQWDCPPSLLELIPEPEV